MSLHGEIAPAEVRLGEPVSAKLIFQRKENGVETSPQVIPCRVWRLSPLGIELIPSGDVQLKTGETVNLEITVGKFHQSCAARSSQPRMRKVAIDS